MNQRGAVLKWPLGSQLSFHNENQLTLLHARIRVRTNPMFSNE